MAATGKKAPSAAALAAIERIAYNSMPKLDRQRVLALGCSNMQLLFSMKRRHPSLWITVLSGSQAELNKALNQANSKGVSIKFMQGSPRKLPFDDGSFNVLIGCTALVPDDATKRAETLGEFYRVLRASGHLILTGEPKKKDFEFALEGSGFEQVSEHRASGLRVYTATKVEPEQLLSQPL